MVKKDRILLLIAGLMIWVAMQATPNYMLKRLSISEGLSQSTVQSILRDSRGYLWVGTRYGLNRWINKQMVSYYAQQDSLSIPDNDINLIWEDANQDVWVACNGGVCVYDYKKDNFKTVLSPSGKPLQIRSSVNLKNGSEIIMGDFGALYKYDTKTRQITQMPMVGGTTFYFSAIMPRNDHEWILATRWDGLWKYNPNTGETERLSYVKEKEISAAVIDAEDRLWISVYGEGVRCYDNTGLQLFASGRNCDGQECGIVLHIEECGSEMWLATDGAGLKIIDKSTYKMRPVETDYSYPLLSVVTLYDDSFGNLYAGTVRDGAMLIHSSAIRTYPHTPDGRNNFVVTSFLFDSEKRITYYGVDGAGIYKSDMYKDKLTPFPETEGMKVTSMLDMGNDRILFGTFDKGIYWLTPSTGKVQAAGAPFSDIVKGNEKKGLVYELAHLDNGKVAVFTDSIYICDLNTGFFKKVKDLPRQNKSGSFRPIGYTPGNLWFLGSNVVLRMQLDNYKVNLEYSEPVIGNIHDASIDPHGKLYVATSHGIVVVDLTTGRSKVMPEFKQRVNTIFSDGDYLWIGANKTLFRKDLRSGSLTEFNTYDGVYPNEFINRAKLVNRNYLLLGGINGLLVANKDEINDYLLKRPSQSQLKIELAGLKVDGQSYHDQVENGKVKIPRSHAVVDLSVVELEPNPLRTKTFRFLIKGAGQEWTVDCNERNLQLSMLKPGSDYTISVSCSTIDGNWTKPVPILEVTVPHGPFMSWWAWMIYGLVAIALVAFFIWRRSNKLNRELNRRERYYLEKEVGFLVNINHELRSSLSMIYGPLRRLTKKLTEQGENTELIGEMRHIAHQAEKMRDVINMSMEMWRSQAMRNEPHLSPNPLNEKVREVVGDFQRACEKRSLKLSTILAPDTEMMAIFDPSHTTMALNNMIVTSMKMCKPGDEIVVSTEIADDKDHATFSVEFPVQGLGPEDLEQLFTQFGPEDTGQFGTGLGLAYAKLLVEMQKGTIQASLSDDCNFLTLTVSLPLPKSIGEVEEAKEAPLQLPLANELDSKPTVAEFNATGLTALIVEKDTKLANFMMMEFKSRFKNAIVSNDPRNSLIQINNVKPDIIVSCDLGVITKVKDDAALKHIPVLYLSTSNDGRQQEAAYRAGADSYLAKPFDMDLLISRCINLLYTRAMLRQRYQSIDSSALIKDMPKNNSDETFLININNIIQENVQNPEFSVNMIVEKMVMSRSAVYTRFKELTGQSIGVYITEYRIVKAKEMLTDPGVPINEVSDMLGFSNQRYFSTFFKSKTGLTPSQWRSNTQTQPVLQ